MPRTTALMLAYLVKKLVTFGRLASVKMFRLPKLRTAPTGTSTLADCVFGSSAYVVSQPPCASTMMSRFGVPIVAPNALRAGASIAAAAAAPVSLKRSRRFIVMLLVEEGSEVGQHADQHELPRASAAVRCGECVGVKRERFVDLGRVRIDELAVDARVQVRELRANAAGVGGLDVGLDEQRAIGRRGEEVTLDDEVCRRRRRRLRDEARGRVHRVHVFGDEVAIDAAGEHAEAEEVALEQVRR